MAKVKIVMIGGGSYLWSPGIISEIISKGDLEGSTITLVDIDPEALHLIMRLGKRISDQSGKDFKIEGTTNRREALKNADYVILTVSTGGLDAMRRDLEIPLKYGIYQSVGDTVGPGGISRILRNVPVVIDIAKDMEELCPDAWLLNYTNPMAPLCRAIYLTTKVKIAGMCPGLYGQLYEFKKVFELEDDSNIHVSVGGINHFYWILEMHIKDEDGFRLLEELIKEGKKPLEPVTLELFKAFGYLPGPADRHIVEFFPFFLNNARAREKYDIKLTTIDERVQSRSRLKAHIREMVEGTKPLTSQPSHIIEMSAEIISVLANQKDGKFILNLPNKGQIANLPKDSIVETLSIADSNGIKGITIGDIPNEVLNFVHSHIIEHELAVQAALKGDKETALKAVLMDPLVQDFDVAEEMLEELLEANAKFLPQFFK